MYPTVIVPSSGRLMNARSTLVLAGLCASLLACDDAPDTGPMHEVVREMLGDTTVVHGVGEE